jgi:hypothetical protein
VYLRTYVADQDRWSLRLGLVSLAAIAVVELICKLPGLVSFVMIPLSLLGYMVGLIVILATTVYLVLKRRPRRGASVFLIFLLPALLWWPINWADDLVHLGLTVGFGIGQDGVVSTTNSRDFKAYDWSVGLAGGPSTILIHDVTDDIALPISQHTHPPSDEGGFAEECAGKVRHLAGHYYVCTF